MIHGFPSIPEWYAAGLCNNPGNDPAWWFPEPGAGGSIGAARALEVCALCPVRKKCGDAATERGEQHGIWGGRNVSASAVNRAKERAA